MLDIFKMPLHHTIIELWKADQEAEKTHSNLALYKSETKNPDSAIIEALEVNLEYTEHRKDTLLSRLQELEDKANLDLLTEKQKILEFCLRLLYKFTVSDELRNDITDRTRDLATKWKCWQQSEWIEHNGEYIPRSFAQVLEGINRNLDTYEEMLNHFAKSYGTGKTINEQLAELIANQKLSKDGIDTLNTKVDTTNDSLETIKSSNIPHKASPDRLKLSMFIVSAQKELLVRRQNRNITSDISKIKTPSIAQALQFIEKCQKDMTDKWHTRCVSFYNDVSALANTEDKSRDEIIRGLTKSAQKSRLGVENWEIAFGIRKKRT